MSVSITFLGGVGTTTGSRYLLTAGSERILIDCGLFEGSKELRTLNWKPFPISPHNLNAVLLTHSHLENAGYLPRLVADGFQGSIYCSEATKSLCSLVLCHNAQSMVENASHAKHLNYSKHLNPQPLYTIEHAQETLKYFEAKEWEEVFRIGEEFEVCLHYAGHILGAAHILVKVRGLTILFSGNIGRLYDPLLLSPSSISNVDFLVLESTYGDRLHTSIEPETEIASVLKEPLEKNAVVLISASAVWRPQFLLSLLNELKANRHISNVPIYVDSFMSAEDYRVFEKYEGEYRLSIEQIKNSNRGINFICSESDSRALQKKRGPMIIVSGSEMATNGRILEHLKTFGADPNNLILFTGFPTVGTRGAHLLSGHKSIKIHGAHWPIRAEVKLLQSLAYQADYSEILEWLSRCKMRPQEVFITHGEAIPSNHLRTRIENELHWTCSEPTLGETVVLPTSNVKRLERT